MKINGISAFERNIEKFVLGGVAAAFLGVVALQFLHQPNTITVQGKPVPPADAYRDLEQRAQVLNSRMVSPEPELPGTRRSVDLLSRFRGSTEGDVAPVAALSWSQTVPQIGIADVGGGNTLGARVAEAVPPAPKGPIANVTGAAIDPLEVVDAPDLARLLPAQQPFDKQAVTVEAVFDGTALRAALMADPDGNQPIVPMPATWWQNSVEILGARLERQEMASSGDWLAATEVPPMPGRIDLAAEASRLEGGAKSDLDAIIGDATADPAQARRPDYYRTIAGPAWLAPREAAESAPAGGNKAQIDRLVARQAELQQQIADTEAELKNATEPKGPTPPGGGESGGKGRSGQGSGRTPAPPAPKTPVSKAQLERKLKSLRDQAARVEKDLKDQGYQAPVDGSLPAAATKAKALLEDASVRVWAHDVTAEPGKTYRYRVRVAVNNPAFDRAAFISADQASFAAKSVLLSAPSEWTAPITVDGTECYFIVGASEGGEGPLGGTRATAEVYKFFYGYWRQARVNLEPGDMLASTARLPELFTYDVTKLAAAPTEIPSPEVGRPGQQITRTPGSETGANTPAPPGQIPVQRDLPIVINAVLLDVARVPGGFAPQGMRAGGENISQALIRDISGSIVTRIPDLDRASKLYEKVARSAREGTFQGAPAVPKDEGPGRPPRSDPNKPPEPPPGKSGGGAGPGGGG